jgi:hypothetical protein
LREREKMEKPSNTRAGVVLTHLAVLVLPALMALPTAAQIPDTASDRLTIPFSRAAVNALGNIQSWKEKATVEAQSGMLNATYGDNLRTAANADLRQAQFASYTLGDKQAVDLLQQHFANVKSWIDELVQARQDMGMDPGGLGQDPDLLRLDECEKALNAMLGNGTYSGIDACE